MDYYLLKIDFKEPVYPDIFNNSTDFIAITKNASYQKDICLDAARYALKLGEESCLTEQEGKEIAKIYYDKAEDILLNQNDNNNELIDLYIELSKVYLEYENEYTGKINKFKDDYNMPLKNMINSIKYDIDNNSEENIQGKLNNLIQDDSISNTQKLVAQNFKLLFKLNKGIDYEQSADILGENLKTLNNEYQTDKSNKILGKHIYDVYKRLSISQYNVGKYIDSGHSLGEISNLASDLKLPQNELEKLKVYETLVWYKAKLYTLAEEKCLEFLEMISGINKDNARETSYEDYISGKTEIQNKKIASVIETLGIINLKNRNYKDAVKYYEIAVDIRKHTGAEDIYLANDYAALARLAILNYKFLKDNISSKDMHAKCLEILDRKYPNAEITHNKHEFHKKYYGFSAISLAKYFPFRNESAIIDGFKCYNRELNICE